MAGEERGGVEIHNELLESVARRLFPLSRSIAGPALRESLLILSELMPLELIEIPSGRNVFDWQVPLEWELERAQIIDEENNLILDSDQSNLHVLNFSEPANGWATGEEILANVYSDPERPNTIPYRTSYYEPRWGFCMKHRDLQMIDRQKRYRYFIKARKFPGSLTIGETVLPGASNLEVVFTSYLCHPSMAVNELSGPLALLSLYHYVKSLPERRFTYRFVVSSETIGALSYLAHRGLGAFDKMIAGATFQMTGLDAPLVTRPARKRSALDKALEEASASEEFGVVETLPWSPAGGGDQRQWTSNKVNLPMSYVSRTIGGAFPEYHSSDDNLDLISYEHVRQSAAWVFDAVSRLEKEVFPVYIGPPGEPFLSKYGLQSTLGGPRSSSELDVIKLVLGYADGSNSATDLSGLAGVSREEIISAIGTLEVSGLITV